MKYKTWLITGASSGIGLNLTEKLLADGHKVIATVRRPKSLQALENQYGDQLTVELLDLTDTSQIYQMVDTVFKRSQSIDVVVSNAGYGLYGAAEELSNEQIERQIDTNLYGSIHLIRSVIPHLRKQGGGRIVQLSSEGGRIAYAGFSLYHATKWGIEGFVKSVSQEVADFNIDFILIEPGPTDTGFGDAINYAESMDCYQGTVVSQFRDAVRSGNFVCQGDLDKTVNTILTVARQKTPPMRVALGSSAYNNIRQSLQQQLKSLEEQKVMAYEADK